MTFHLPDNFKSPLFYVRNTSVLRLHNIVIYGRGMDKNTLVDYANVSYVDLGAMHFYDSTEDSALVFLFAINPLAFTAVVVALSFTMCACCR